MPNLHLYSISSFQSYQQTELTPEGMNEGPKRLSCALKRPILYQISRKEGKGCMSPLESGLLSGDTAGSPGSSLKTS